MVLEVISYSTCTICKLLVTYYLLDNVDIPRSTAQHNTAQHITPPSVTHSHTYSPHPTTPQNNTNSRHNPPDLNTITNGINIHPPAIEAPLGVTEPEICREADDAVPIAIDGRSVDGVRRVEDDIAGLEGADEPGPAVRPRELQRFLGDQARRHHVLVEGRFRFFVAQPRAPCLLRERIF